MDTSASQPCPSDFRDRLLIEQVTMVCRFSGLPLVGTLGIGGVLCWILLAERTLGLVAGWFGIVVAVNIVRAILGWRFLTRPRTAPEARRWSIAILCAAAITGFLWAYASIWLMPREPLRELTASLFFVGAVATGVATLSPIRFGYGALLIPFLVPYTVNQFVLGGERLAVGYGAALYILLMLFIAHTYRSSVQQILSLRLMNEALVQRLSAEKARVEAASRAKTQFLANMSHEVRTPMNAILGMTEMLLRSPLDLKQRQFARTALKAGRRLMHLIDDVLDLSRIEAGKIAVAQVDFSPQALTQEVVELMTPLAAEKTLALSQFVAADVPQEVHGDPHRIRQVLVNLVANAIKFTERGSITVELRTAAIDAPAIEKVGPRPEGEAQVGLRWAVVDTGIGVEAEAHARLFAPFSQADDSTTRRYGGTGLGLAISRQVVEAMHGRIDFSSEVGRGSTFWFEVPLRIGGSQSRPGGRQPAAPQPDCHGRVLIVEDNAVNRSLLQEMLPLLGVEASVAETGTQALAMIEQESFDLVLMDWHMPDIDGLEATRRIRQAEETAPNPHGTRLRIVALTASAMPGDREACLEAGMDDYLSKPFTYDELAAVLRRWLGRSATRVA